MSKVVYNATYGGFFLSEKAFARYAEITGKHLSFGESRALPRHDPALIQVVEELGDDANGACAALLIGEVPAGTKYRIAEYDGLEGIETEDDIEWQVAP